MIVDEACLDVGLRRRWQVQLAGVRSWWVAVRCEHEEMLRRERERGDRPIGLAAAQAAVVHRQVSYDLELDTTHDTPELAALRLSELVSPT